VPVAAGNTLFIRRQDAVLALRPLSAKNVEGKEVACELVNDGLSVGAIRLTALHDDKVTGAPATSASGLWPLKASTRTQSLRMEKKGAGHSHQDRFWFDGFPKLHFRKCELSSRSRSRNQKSFEDTRR